MKNIDNKNRNSLTAPEKYKKYNVEMIDAYISLHPFALSKLSISLFNAILATQHNVKSKRYKLEESKRIFNNTYISLEDILNRCHPVKYNIENKSIENDMSNLMGRIQELDDNNIFYVWKFSKPITYMFVIERDIGLWKYFNPKAFVTPKTIKKIIALHKYMIDSMFDFEKKRGRRTKREEIEKSFINEFLNGIIDKTNPSVKNKIKNIEKDENYLDNLKHVINQIDDYEGYVQDELFLNRLPYHLQEKINITKKGENMDFNMLSNALVPQNENLIQEKPIKKKKRKITYHNNQTTFKDYKPFSNCNDFIKYYREIIKMHNEKANFYPIGSERMIATKIMDALIEKDRSKDTDFLRAWIRYYIQSYLNGNNIMKKEKTSLHSFFKTFDMYNNKYFKG